jgi:hypothetical protein
LAGFLDVANVYRDVIDAEDTRALRMLFTARGKHGGLQNYAEGKKSGCVLQSTGKLGKTLHDLRDYISQVAEGAGGQESGVTFGEHHRVRWDGISRLIG